MSFLQWSTGMIDIRPGAVALVNPTPEVDPNVLPCWKGFELKKNKKGNPMYAFCLEDKENPTETELQRRYLLNQVDGLNDDHTEELRKKYRMDNPRPPCNFNDLKKAFADNTITYTGKEPDKEHWDIYDLLARIKWRAEDDKPDDKGYDKAFEKLQAARTKAEDEIVILPLEEALAAKRGFETLH
jgi:hypothetical protein